MTFSQVRLLGVFVDLVVAQDEMLQVLESKAHITTFREDNQGELYVGTVGAVYRLAAR